MEDQQPGGDFDRLRLPDAAGRRRAPAALRELVTRPRDVPRRGERARGHLREPHGIPPSTDRPERGDRAGASPA
ncbi:hypothetical protein HBB16_00635 [Pseudonocardia sp. MCCB 268]|nr:hypothetical protein [Pseudonocardia cytotoxica]